MIRLMGDARHQFYFVIALAAILAVGSFGMIEITKTMTDLALIEGSFYVVVRNGEARLSAEINRGIEDIDLDALEEGIKAIDAEIDTL